MRPLVVTMQAFGPYAGLQTLDFADLRGNGFFLITGPTGAGKTTILDAMSFALYGETSGGLEKDGARSGASMRSDHADPGMLTRVCFDFSLGADLYRAERTPEQQRPKVRGEGTTTHLQEATLWRLHGAGADGLQPDGQPLATGWSKVTAKAEDILGFRAEQFRQVVMLPQGRFQQFLEADSGQREQILRALFETGHYADIERALHDEALALRRSAEKIATQRDEVLRQAEADDAEALADRCARLAVDFTEACQHAEQAARDDAAAQQALAGGREAARKLKERDDAAAEVAALAARDGEVQTRRAELEAARRAAEVADVARQAAEAASHLAAARTAATAADEAATAAAAALAAAQAALETEVARTGEREHAAAEASRLQGYADGAEALAGARQVCDRTAGALQACRQRCGAGRRGLDRRTGPRGGPRGGVGRGAGRAPRRRAGRGTALSGVWLDRPPGAGGAARRGAVPGRGRGGARRGDARARAARRRTRSPARGRDGTRSRGRARRRARGEHPARARRPRGSRGGARRRESPGRRAGARPRRGREGGAQLRGRRLGQGGGARDDGRRPQSGRRARRRRRRAPGAPPRVVRLLGSRGPAGGRSLPAGGRGARGARQGARGRDPQGRGAAPGRGRRTPRDSSLLQLDLLEQAAATTAAAAGTAHEAAATLKAHCAAAEKQLARLHGLEAEAEGVAGRYESVGRLADVAGGRNGRRISFQSYVLGAFLDDVLVAASERLRLMSRNRYALDRTEERSGRRQSAGLDLVVYDAWTGVARAVSTLSGGEKFMAALSLALGLAEVVQAFAGGIRLETVFVDEGFGSLDDESLDLAIASLESLNAGGRLVGIISHVSELRERVYARLEVTSDKSGSSAAFHVA